MSLKLKLNQAGLGAPLIILVVVALLGIGGAGYYVYTQQKDKDGSSASQTPEQQAAEAECKSVVSDENICKLAGNWSMSGQTRSVITSTTADGQTGTITIESDGQGNSRFVTTSNGQTVGGFVHYNNATYVQNPGDGSWTKYAGDQEDNYDPLDDFDSTFDFEEDKPEAERTQYKALGKEACGEHTCFKYQVIDPTKPADEMFIWFDDQEYKLRRLTFKNDEQNGSMEIFYESVNITEPSPVKAAPALDAELDAETQAQLEAAMQQYQN